MQRTSLSSWFWWCGAHVKKCKGCAATPEDRRDQPIDAPDAGAAGAAIGEVAHVPGLITIVSPII